MKALVKGISYIGLLATIVPSILVFSGVMQLSMHKMIMVIGMVLWFATAPFTINK